MSTAWFSKALLPWYREHQRALPWREPRSKAGGAPGPYQIWLSEVILQQTRVDQGTSYWHRFVERYPTVQDLARSTEDEVLRMWQGLGYYSRARNLRTAAQQVLEEHGGEFPANFVALRKLKGVGDYTAAAIGSIAFGLVEPVVDGNVYRVLSRVFGIATPIDGTAGRKEFRELAARLMSKEAPGDHNQAVMELGALVCTPKNPHCDRCPVAQRCIARSTDRISTLPVKAGKTLVRERHFNYLDITSTSGFYLQKRTEKDIWQGLYDLPLLETDKATSAKAFKRLLSKTFGAGWQVQGMSGPVKHVLSHQVIHARFWRTKAPNGFKAPQQWIKVRPNAVDKYALPRLIERYLATERP